MFVANDLGLVWDQYLNQRLGFIFLNGALAREARLNAWANGPINKIFFLVRNFGEIILSRLYVDVASTAGANHPAVAVDVHPIVFGEVQNIIANHSFDLLCRNAGIFKCKSYNCH